MSESVAEDVARLLKKRGEKVVFAESCTAGGVCLFLAQVPGISAQLCGSLVTYRPRAKGAWLGVRKKTIRRHSPESFETATEMALGALKVCEEADWSVSVVGHVGPNSPVGKDGMIFVVIARRRRKKRPRTITSSHYLAATGRVERQHLAAEVALRRLHIFLQGGESDES